jgi:hypothetical protein
MVHTCPRCELRFLTAAELTEHLRVDHHMDTDGFERFHYKPLERRPPTKRYVVIGNQTLSDESLIDRLRELAKDGHIHLVVPATTSKGGLETVDEESLTLATFRMRHAIDRLHELGVDAEGEVGGADPIRAFPRRSSIGSACRSRSSPRGTELLGSDTNERAQLIELRRPDAPNLEQLVDRSEATVL